MGKHKKKTIKPVTFWVRGVGTNEEEFYGWMNHAEGADLTMEFAFWEKRQGAEICLPWDAFWCFIDQTTYLRRRGFVFIGGFIDHYRICSTH